MGNNYIFSLTPTFTQGLLLGQLSIVVVVVVVLKYLFFLPHNDDSEAPSFHPFSKLDQNSSRTGSSPPEDPKDAESAHWFNSLSRQVADVYRAKLQNGLGGSEGNEVARVRLEAYANKIRPRSLLDHITIHAIDLGNSAPSLSNAQVVADTGETSASMSVKFRMSYSDCISVSLSTAYLFNYPMTSFARLPVSLTISLDLFESSVTIVPPSPLSSEPALMISFPSEFALNLRTTSLMGSRAMLKDVPKLHELIEHQVRRALASRGPWKIVLPGLGNITGSTETRQ